MSEPIVFRTRIKATAGVTMVLIICKTFSWDVPKFSIDSTLVPTLLWAAESCPSESMWNTWKRTSPLLREHPGLARDNTELYIQNENRTKEIRTQNYWWQKILIMQNYRYFKICYEKLLSLNQQNNNRSTIGSGTSKIFFYLILKLFGKNKVIKILKQKLPI